jgi:hypothetical protein
MDQERRDFLQDSARLGGFALASAALWRIEPVLAQSGRGHELGTMTMVGLSQLLASQKISSRQLVEQGVGTPPAMRDSSVVERLKKAGALIIGRTNLVEFAYSGLGINPHYGTPKNAFDRATGRIPGGSSSGAAISVTDGMAAGAIGTDTGGSIRIPATLNGLVGFKPTARRVPLDGVLPLSFTLDSAGPIAKTVADCALLDQVLAAEERTFPRLPICAACVSRCPARCSRTTCRQRSPTASGRLSPACRPPARPWSSFPWPNSPKPRPSTRAVH